MPTLDRAESADVHMRIINHHQLRIIPYRKLRLGHVNMVDVNTAADQWCGTSRQLRPLLNSASKAQHAVNRKFEYLFADPLCMRPCISPPSSMRSSWQLSTGRNNDIIMRHHLPSLPPETPVLSISRETAATHPVRFLGVSIPQSALCRRRQ